MLETRIETRALINRARKIKEQARRLRQEVRDARWESFLLRIPGFRLNHKLFAPPKQDDKGAGDDL